MAIDNNQIIAEQVPMRNVGFSSKKNINTDRFKQAIIDIFAKIDDIENQLSSDSTNIIIDGRDMGDKTGIAASFAIPQALNKYENQASLILDLFKKDFDLSEKISSIVRG